LSRRIESSSIQLGNSFILGDVSKKPEIEELPDLRHEELLQEANRQAEAIIASARAEAENIVNQARQEAEEIKQNAHQQGLEEGFQSGYQNGQNEAYDKVMQDFSSKLNSIAVLAKASFDVKNTIIKSSEQEILDLAILLAEKIVKTHIDINPDVIKKITQAAISELKDKEEVKILINPEISRQIHEAIDEFKININGLGSIKIIEDRTVSPDGVIVESPDSRIDARLSTQISQITKEIMTEYTNNPVLETIPEEIENLIEDVEVIDP